MSQLAAVIEGGGNGLRISVIDNHYSIISEHRLDQGNFNEIKCKLQDYLRILLNNTSVDKTTPLIITMAGLAQDKDIQYVDDLLNKLNHQGKKIITTDAHTAYWGAHRNHGEIVVISGTGSIAFSVNESGDLERVGGWGSRLGDQGSGYWLGLQLLKQIIKNLDHYRGKNRLIEFTEDYYQMDGWRVVRRFISSSQPTRDISGISEILLQAADQGIQEAVEIFKRGAEELSEQVKHLAKKVKSNYYALRGGICLNYGYFCSHLEKELTDFGLSKADLGLSSTGGAVRLFLSENHKDFYLRGKYEKFFIKSNYYNYHSNI
jgi:N-acetylglucosamine kinase-like BadF-type ATPase